jgi:hypothetical protein
MPMLPTKKLSLRAKDGSRREPPGRPEVGRAAYPRTGVTQVPSVW